MSEQSIGDILNGTEPEATEAPAEVAEAPEAAEAAPVEEGEPPKGPERDPATGKFIPKGEPEPPVSAPPAQQEEPGHIPIAALKDERNKRQALENDLAQVRQQLAQMQQAPAAPPAPTDFWEDPEGYIEAKAAKLAQEQATQIVQGQILSRSMNKVKPKYDDFDEAARAFGEMIQANPTLYDQMLAADEPAEFAYSQAKTQMAIREAGSIDAYIQAQVEARINAQLSQVTQQLPQSAPPTISSDRSVGARSGPAWSGPASLGDLLR